MAKKSAMPVEESGQQSKTKIKYIGDHEAFIHGKEFSGRVNPGDEFEVLDATGFMDHAWYQVVE